MSEKRKFEDLLDPDYPQNVKLMKSDGDRAQQLSPDERMVRIRAIVKREFQKELTSKEQEIMEIDNRIQLARKLLHRVRYAVVSNYYNKKGTELPDSEAQGCVESLELKSTAPPANERDQKAIHPALKSILGKQSVDYSEILKARPTREAAKTAKTSIKEKLRTKKEEKRLQRAKNGAMNTVICYDETPKVPRHVEPNKVDKEIPQLNIARGKNQTKHLIAVGNTSKYVGDEKFANGVTHKWLVYVKTKTPVPVEKIVTKVRFFLHPSYRPNDIVDVCEPPFQLSRRGWGEFPVRLQLSFEASLQQKPIQVMHNLVLDKSLTGLQTMGAETLMEMWLRTDHIQTVFESSEISLSNSQQTAPDEASQESEGTSKMEHIDDKLMDFLNRIEGQSSKSLCEEEEKIEATISVAPQTIGTEFTGDDPIASASLNHFTLKSNPKMRSAGAVHNKSVPENFNFEPNLGANCLEKPATPSIPLSSTCADQKSGFSLAASQQVIQESERIVLGTCATPLPTFNVLHEPALGHSLNRTESGEIMNNSSQNVHAVTSKEPPKSTAASQSKLSSSSVKIVPEQNVLIAQKANPTNNHIEPLAKIPSNPPIVTSLSSTSNKPQIFQKRLVKCIDKRGNVKFVQMLVKAPDAQNGQSKCVILNSSTAKILTQQPVASKTNGQIQEQTKPLVFKIAPTTTALPTKAPTVSTAPTNSVNILSSPKSLPPSAPVLPVADSKLLATKENQSNLTVSKSLLNSSSTNRNQVLVKNGKMYIIDPLQAKIKQQTKKQESLLKPQVSLLKPIVKNDNLNNCIRNDANRVFNHTAIATDHDYTSLLGKSPTPNKITINRPVSNQHALLHRQKSSIVTVNSPNNSRINVIVTKLDDDDEDHDAVARNCNPMRGDFESKLNAKGVGMPKPSTALMQKPRRDYRRELEVMFGRTTVESVRHGVEFLLKRLPLINAKASSSDYSASFPFVVKSRSVFDAMTTPKLKANEWLRAKHILHLLQKHPHFDAANLWTTKEITLFARLHAYTPVIKYNNKKESNEDNETTNRTLKDLVKKEIKREKYDIQTVTLVHDTYDWIQDVRQKINRDLYTNEEIIDVDSFEDDDDNKNKDSTKKQNVQSPVKNITGKYIHPLDSNFESEVSFVSDACQQIGIRLKPEEIVTDVLHPSAQLVLAQCLRSFVDDLSRRAAACRPDADMESALVENVLRPNDIKNAILSRTQFDFLTNNALGVARAKEQNK